ncbi:coiled-coil domain-containing protein 116 [Heteronotia binoei]|uniref:coiled-coil domain-containing protein 116 n=1 Tax=Heteronotia binoei TaxID=13085 RepID=UPI0029309CB2|nr:coiled-coil domain-containing protein 116 [Heteronotia binoei]
MRNRSASHGRDHDHWRNMMRPPSRCGFRNRDATPSHFSASSAFADAHQGKRKRHGSASGESSLADDEFSDFMNFLADEDVLDSLQSIVEDAVRRLRDVTTEDGERVFDIVEDSCSSRESASWSVSYSHRHTDSSSTYSHSKYCTTTATATTTATSSSDEGQERQFQSKEKQKPVHKVCLLDKFVSRLAKPKKEKKVSGGFHAETLSERSGDTYYFLQEHFHIWAKLAESFHQLPKKDYFSKFKKLPKQKPSAESLHKEITNVLKQPTPSTLLLYASGQEPFQALDFLEENGMLAALQDIINQAVQKVLEATLGDGAPLFDIFGEEGRLSVPWESSMGGSEEEEEGEGEEDGREGSGSGGETSEVDSKSDAESTPGRKKKRRKGKYKKKASEATEEGKGKPKYTPPPLPKSRRKSNPPEEPPRKPKYVPPPLPKTKPRPPPEEPPPKPKYAPPPLPKPKKKQEAVQTEGQGKKNKCSVIFCFSHGYSSQVPARHVITTKDIKRARLQARPLPKQAIIDFLIENAAKLIVYKYNYETILSEKLGFISVPVTKVLLEIMFGYKRVKGSGIRLSSQIDWTKVNEEIYAPRPPRPKTPKLKPGDKKKAGDKKKKAADKKKPSDMKKSVAFKPEMPTGKVVVTATPIEKKEVKVSKPKGRPSSAEKEGSKKTEIIEILPPQFPQEGTVKEGSETSQPLHEEPSKKSLSINDQSPARSMVSQKSFFSKDSPVRLPNVTLESEGPLLSPKQSVLSRRLSGEANDSKRGSTASVLPEVEPPNHPSIESLKKSSSYRKASVNGETSRKSSIVLPKI